MNCRRRNRQSDVEGQQEEPVDPQRDEHPETNTNNQNDASQTPEERQDFDDNANKLWSLYDKEAETHDKARIETLKDDMDSVLIFAGLFSAVLTAFVVPQIQNLQVNPADQSVYYQNQSVQMLGQISQQLASVGSQITTNLIPPTPYPTFHASASDRRVNIFWLISLVCSLSAALLATLVQQWVRAYMRIFQHSSNPLKTARIRLFLFEGAKRLPMVAEVVPGLIHVSVILFFWGLGDTILQTDTTVFIFTVLPLGVCICLYLYCVVAPIWKPQSPYRTPFSSIIWYLIRKLHRSPSYKRFIGKLVKLANMASMAIRQERFAMEKTEDRLHRDVRAVQWLVDNIDGSNETETFVLSIPGSFNKEWGRDVWKGVVSDDQPTPIDDPQIQTLPGIPSLRKGTTVSNLSRCVRNFFDTYSNEGDSMDAKERRRRMRGMRGCVETTASLVCCAEVELDLFGEIGEMLQVSAMGDKERTNDPLTISSNPSFTVRWTCLSLVAFWKKVNGNRLQQLAKFALDGIAYSQPEHDTIAMKAAQRIDDYLTKAWASVVDLHLAFKTLNQNRTESDIKEILNSHEASISELERIAIEAVGVEEVDWRISLLQVGMDKATHKLMRCLPGVSFSELKPDAPVIISEAFDFSFVETTPVPPQLIFPGQQIQSLCTLGRRLRDIIDEQNTEKHKETLEILESLNDIPVALREVNYPMKRQIWRLMDLHDGSGLGFTVELFFLALRQLSSASLSDEMKKVFYTGTFKVITSKWEKSKNSAGTQRVLLDLLCDLVIRSRGVFSDFSYPPYIVDMLLELVEKTVKGHRGSRSHIDDVIKDLENFKFWSRMDHNLQDRALKAIGPSSDTHHGDSNPVSTGIIPPRDAGPATVLEEEVGGQGFAEGDAEAV